MLPKELRGDRKLYEALKSSVKDPREDTFVFEEA